MGKVDIVLKNYFRDTFRLADLFDGVFFGGVGVIKAEDLTDASTFYAESSPIEKEDKGIRDEHDRDIRMILKNGVELRLLALENQNKVNYAMPYRCLQYDTMEYTKQVDEIRNRNKRAGEWENGSEWLGKFKKADRLTPIYTLCVYYGKEPWDGPRSLKDMMNFGDDIDGWGRLFTDYPMRLYCVNERENFHEFHSEIAKVFYILRFARSKTLLRHGMEAGDEKWRLDSNSLEVVTTLLGATKIWENRKMYQTDNEKEEYDMWPALNELLADEREVGIEQGVLMTLCGLLKKGIITLEDAVNQSGMSEEDFREKARTF